MDVVKEFHELKTKEKEIVFVQKYQKSANISIRGYVCAIEMKQAKYTFNPMKKLRIFNSSKEKLDSLIQQDSLNVHLRYVRLVLQETTPIILGYKKHISIDKALLKKSLEIKDETDFLDSYIYKNTSL